MENEYIKSATGRYVVVGNGTVNVPIEGGTRMHANHNPEFSTILISVRKLSEHFNINFTRDHPAHNGKTTSIIMKRTYGGVVQ